MPSVRAMLDRLEAKEVTLMEVDEDFRARDWASYPGGFAEVEDAYRRGRLSGDCYLVLAHAAAAALRSR